MPAYRGTHGTTQRCAAEILSGGFRLSTEGRAGRGVYFWQYFADVEIAKELAIRWFEQQNKRRAYPEPDPQCAVISGKFEVSEDDVLDCSGELIEEITLTLQRMVTWTDDDIGATYESLISRIEALRGKPIMLVKTMVSPPKGAFKPKQVLPYPGALIVRDKSVEIDAELLIV